MFFILSKIFEFFLHPLNWIIIFCFSAIFFKRPLLRKVFIYLSVSSVLIFTTPMPIYFLAKAWDVKTKSLKEFKDSYDIAIVLGGFSKTVLSEPDMFYITSSGDRILKAVQLYKAKKINKIFISGGSGRVFAQHIKEGKISARFLYEIGVDSADVLYEDKSKNTYENALFTKHKLDSLGMKNGKTLLLTSNYHMRRSIACFSKQGLKFEPFVVDPQNEEGLDFRNPFSLVLPNVENIKRWEMYIHEWIGYFTYRLNGYI